jgi:hypothetical protein
MDKVHKYNSFNTNTPLSESYRNESKVVPVLNSAPRHEDVLGMEV